VTETLSSKERVIDGHSICNVGEKRCDIAIAPAVDGVGVVHLEPGQRWLIRCSRIADSGSLNEIHGPDGAIVTQGIYDEAMEEIRRLRDDLYNSDLIGIAANSEGVRLMQENRRLRAALERIADPFLDAGTKCLQAISRLRYEAREALAGPADETSEPLCGCEKPIESLHGFATCGRCGRVIPEKTSSEQKQQAYDRQPLDYLQAQRATVKDMLDNCLPGDHLGAMSLQSRLEELDRLINAQNGEASQ